MPKKQNTVTCGQCGHTYSPGEPIHDHNPHNRKTDEHGRIIPTREAYAKEILETIKGYQPIDQGSIDRGDSTEFGFYWEYEDMEECAKKLAQFTAEQAYKDYKDNVNLGIAIGRREAGTMFVSAFEAELGVEPLKQLKVHHVSLELVLDVARHAAEAVSKAGKEEQ